MRIGEFISTPDKLPWKTAGVSVTEKPINPPAVPFPEHTQPFKSLQPFVSGKLSSAHSRHSPYCNSIAKCNLSSQLGQHSFVFDNIVLYCVVILHCLQLLRECVYMLIPVWQHFHLGNKHGAAACLICVWKQCSRVSCVSTHLVYRGTDSLCSRLSSQGCLCSERPWKIKCLPLEQKSIYGPV